MKPTSEITTAIELLQRKRAALVAEIDADIEALERAAAVLSRHSDVPEETPDVTSSAKDSSGRAAAKPHDVARVAAELLRRGPTWHALAAIHMGLGSAGIIVGGADPVNNLSTILSRHKGEFGFVADKRLGWALAERVNGPELLATGKTNGL
jgi:hypothetical protein